MGNNRVGAADFMLCKLKELCKIWQEEIAEFLVELELAAHPPPWPPRQADG